MQMPTMKTTKKFISLTKTDPVTVGLAYLHRDFKSIATVCAIAWEAKQRLRCREYAGYAGQNSSKRDAQTADAKNHRAPSRNQRRDCQTDIYRRGIRLCRRGIRLKTGLEELVFIDWIKSLYGIIF